MSASSSTISTLRFVSGALRAGAPPPALGDAPPRAEVQYFPPAAAGAPERYLITVSWLEPGEDEPFSYRSDVLIVPRAPA